MLLFVIACAVGKPADLTLDAAKALHTSLRREAEATMRRHAHPLSRSPIQGHSPSPVSQAWPVFNPVIYGADPSGVKDSTAALHAALHDLLAQPNKSTGPSMASGIADLGGATLDLADPLVTTTGANQPNLAVRANVLQAGVEYTFKLTATYPGQNPGESTVNVAISTPPRGGKIAVTPETGDELETAFTFTAPNWNGDGVLHYTYVAEDEEGVTTILGHGQKKTTLSGVILNKGDLKGALAAVGIGAESHGEAGATSVPVHGGAVPTVTTATYRMSSSFA